MNRTKERIRQYSSQKYRKTKLSQPSISTKKNIVEKIRLNKFDSEFKEELNRLKTILPKTPPNLSSTSWCLYDANKDDHIGFRDNYQREVASLTKIMTTIVAINLIEKYGLQKQIAVRISRNSSALNGTTAHLKYGKWLKLEDLLYGAMLPSGNDAAYLLSQIFGLMKPEDKQYEDIESIDITLYENTIPFVNRFLKQMNKVAKQLRMYKTNFANPHGLANSLNVSCAKDMLELSRYACKNKLFSVIMNTQKYQCQVYEPDLQSIHQIKLWKNTNKLLPKGWDGVKTGQTQPAGACLASRRQNIYIIILNCNSLQQRFIETEILFDWYKKCQQDQTE